MGAKNDPTDFGAYLERKIQADPELKAMVAEAETDHQRAMADFRSNLVAHILNGQASLGYLLWAGRVLQEAYEIDGGALTNAVAEEIERLAV